MLLDATAQCVEGARSLCAELGFAGPLVMGAALGGLVWARERWKRYRLACDAAEEKRAAEAKIAALKEQRNEHAARAQLLEVKVASLRPPPMPSSATPATDDTLVEDAEHGGDL